ncbi:MAG: MarR family winged helix-turn-helix transcriptional regulator [Eubacteriaceae bacterium]
MTTTEENIADLANLLPMFIGTLLEGSVINIPIKISISEERTLMCLLNYEGDPMTEYSKRVGLNKGSFTSVADRLEKKELIERISISEDRRKYGLILTDKGKRIARKIESDFNEHVAKKVAQLEKKDILDLENSLETLVKIMYKLKERNG